MNKNNTPQIYLCLFWLFTMLSFQSSSVAASSVIQEKIQYQLPSGKSITVVSVGHQSSTRFESIDGYTLIYEKSSGLFYYAQLSADGTQLISTGIRYDGGEAPFYLGLEKHLKPVKPASTLRRKMMQQRTMTHRPRIGQPLTGSVEGVTILIDFSDEPARISKQAVERYLNQRGYTGGGNQGSVRDYWRRVSHQQLDYTNRVTDYIRAPKPKSYYLNCPQGVDCAKELVDYALQQLLSSGFNFHGLTTYHDTYYRVTGLKALNIFYAGSATFASQSNTFAGQPNALWPSTGSTKFALGNGVYATVFQKTNMGDALSIGTFCHENGHMLFNWPDLYHIPGNSGNFDLMASGNYAANGKNPTPPNPYFRMRAGWEVPIEINTSVAAYAPSGPLYSQALKRQTYQYSNPSNPREMYMIETLFKGNHTGGTPENGIAIWHIDDRGNFTQTNCTMGPNCHPPVVLKRKTERNGRSLFAKGGKTQFHAWSSPSSNWWNGTSSGLRLTDVGIASERMCFSIDGSSCTTAPVNAPPKLTVGLWYVLSLSRDRFINIPLQVGDDQTPASQLTMQATVTSGTGFANVYTAWNGQVYLQVQPNRTGTIHVKISVTDAGRLTSHKTVWVGVNP
ncbi:M6 family metalloprotease domain-containing protein [Algicola sagamiensis]|uniref:M6 family metalloprotease domain-containing protein n=1 Tax=Algicola sagamiensis TaxID=163869 RepID=UPI00037C77B4|nr:M6 family metalloprotease domain-containing protein [Algicola sagamiensis]